MDEIEFQRKKTVFLSILGAATVVSSAFENIILPSILEESSDSSSAEEELLPTRKKKRKSADMPRVKNYLEIIVALNEGEFQAHFRLSRDSFNWLLAKIGSRLNYPHQNGHGHPFTNVEKQLLCVLWLLATPDSYRSVACRFGMSKGSLHKIFCRVVKALTWLGPQVCQWPDVVERRRIRRYFKDFAGLDGVVGVVDGTYVPIKAPKVNAISYNNRKCFYGMTLQGICDDRRRFIDAFTGYPSSVSDTRIFKNSTIYKEIERQPEQYFSPHEFIIGDKAYECKTFCIPPYKRGRHFREWQQQFNRIQSRCRQVIERTFALFFGRFRRMKYLDMTRTDWISPTIIAGVVLHNVCLQSQFDRMQVQFEEDGDGARFMREQTVDNPPLHDDVLVLSMSNVDGRLFRDTLADEMGLRPPQE